jgi:hypothetical protein
MLTIFHVYSAMNRNFHSLLFFDCVVAKFIWVVISSVIGKEIGSDFESIVVSIFSSATLWLHPVFT